MSTMTKISLTRKLRVFETNYLDLNPEKENSIAFQAKTQVSIAKSSEDDDLYMYKDNSLAFIAKNFERI